MRNKLKRYLGLRKSFLFLIALYLMFSKNSLAYAWQADNEDGTFKNPIMFADYPDPSMIRVGKYFYLATSTFVNSPGLVICRSEDMVNWEIVGHCMDTLTGSNYDMAGTTKYAGGCFAPSIAYKDGTFYVVVNMNDGQRTRIYYAKDVAGPWKYNEVGGGYFDPCLFIDTDGTPYLAYGGAWQNKISMIQLNSNLSATVGQSKVILTQNSVEGAHLVKAKGKYYLFNAVPAQKLVCSRASNVWGPYSETTTLCTAGKGGHQGAIVDLDDGSYWGYLHQDDGAIGRPTRICPITWKNDWPMFGREGHLGEVESTYTKPIQNKAVKVPQSSDEFNGSSLGLQWMWNHNPDNTKWSLTGSALRLKATTASNFWNARNSLIQKGQGLVSYATIKIDCSKMEPRDIGGLGILGDPRGYIAVTGNPRKIIMSEEDTVKATENNITSNILYFRVDMNFGNKQAKFFWKDDESKNWKALGSTITMGFDWQYGTFQGEQYAILNFNPSTSNGYMDVDYFRLNDETGAGVTAISAFKKIEAESYSGQSGVQTENCSEGGSDVEYIENGDYIIYKNMDFETGAASFQARVSSATQGGSIELRLDSIDGPLVGTCLVPESGDWQTWTTTKCDVSGAKGVHDLYLKFIGGSSYLFNLNWWKFSEAIAPPVGIKGDLNDDGEVDSLDLMLMKKHILEVETLKSPELADLNADGEVNALDFALLKQYILG
jgi:xylan 1,4-beta-xylosidase